MSDFDVGCRAIIAHGGFADLQDVFQAFVIGRFSEDRVLSVQRRHRSEAEEELRAGGVGVVGAGHRQDAGHVLGGVELGGDGVAGPAGAVAVGAAGLNDEAVNDAVKNDAVVIADLREADDVLHVAGGEIGIEVDRNAAHRRVEFDLVGELLEVDVFQGFIDFGASGGRYGAIPSE